MALGEGQTVMPGAYLSIDLLIRDAAFDTIHFVPDYHYLINVGSQPLDSLWQQFSTGDSVIIQIHRKQFNDYLKLYGPMQSDTGTIFLHVRIQDIVPASRLSSYQQKLLSRREVEEQRLLHNYLRSFPDSLERVGEIYRIVQKHTTGTPIETGDEISIHYRGSFLNGYVFDDSRKKGIAPTFKFGHEFQLIEGVEEGLKGLKQGESVKIILPSRRAFGEEGSLAGIVPPYTAVIFDITILNVTK